jgi:hypothetical protein
MHSSSDAFSQIAAAMAHLAELLEQIVCALFVIERKEALLFRHIANQRRQVHS